MANKISPEEAKQAIKSIYSQPQVKMGVIVNKNLKGDIYLIQDFIKSVDKELAAGQAAIEEVAKLKKGVSKLFEIAPAFNPNAEISKKEWDKINGMILRHLANWYHSFTVNSQKH
jgi:hypothetical protein